MYPIKHILLFSFFWTLVNLAYAHSPTEITFRLTEEVDGKYLQAHLTSITLFDMLYHLDPDLQSHESLNLSHFIREYEAYFNERVRLQLNGRDQMLEYVDSNLIIHDSWIKFRIKDFEEEIEEYNIAVHGFDFYSNPSFLVIFEMQNLSDACLLSKTENHCAGVTSNGQSLHAVFDQGLLWFLLSSILVLLLAGYLRKWYSWRS